MPDWSNCPPERTSPRPLQLIRTPVGRALTATITSERLLGCLTHWWGGRTSPCETPHCDACNHGSPTRWHGYLGLYDERTRGLALLELTDSCDDAIRDAIKLYGSLRGCRIKAYRAKASRNGRVILEIRAPAIDVAALPAAPDVPATLAMIWNLPKAATSAPSQPHAIDEIATSSEVADKMRGAKTPHAKR